MLKGSTPVSTAFYTFKFSFNVSWLFICTSCHTSLRASCKVVLRKNFQSFGPPRVPPPRLFPVSSGHFPSFTTALWQVLTEPILPPTILSHIPLVRFDLAPPTCPPEATLSHIPLAISAVTYTSPTP